MSTYEPGTYAVATVRDVPNVRIMRNAKTPHDFWYSPTPVHGYRVHEDSDVADVRPLVVLDLDNHAEIAVDLRDAARVVEDKNGWVLTAACLRSLANQIEAQTKPPKPDEPKGLGAVVEDSHGEKYVQVEPLGGVWRCTRTADAFTWDAIPAVRILSDGWVSQP